MTPTLEQVLADAGADADVLERRGIALLPVAQFRELLGDVRRAASGYLTFLSETEAVLYSGHTRVWLRQRYVGWERDGHARRAPTNARERQYRQCVLPRRVDLGHVQADAQAQARADAAAVA